MAKITINPLRTQNTVPTISGTNLQLAITAAQYSSGSWGNLTGSKDVHLFISYKG